MNQLLLQSFWLVPCYALVGMLLSILWFPGITRRTGPRPAGYVNLIMTFLSFFHAVTALPSVWNQPPQEVIIPWLQVAGLDLTITLQISALSVGATALITGLNLMAQIYALGYMEMDWGWARFFSLLALFEAGMCALVICDSLFFSYFLLEILTLGTYLLLGFWFNQSLVVTGARDAFLTKRVGDLFLLMAVIAILPIAGTWSFSELAVWATSEQAQAFAASHPVLLTLLGCALIAGPMGKCAQFPLHLWLDEAMEGPIPSSILRNSVVVAVGAWVLVKLQPVLALSPFALNFTIVIGALSAIGGSLIAIAQIDIKRTLSYLVTAYMGMIFIAVGVQQPSAALLLVLTHALSMALLVMSTGSVIWNSITQDVTQLGGLWSRRPVSGLAFLVGTAGLIALPPLGSFWAFLQLADALWGTRPWLLGVLLVTNALTAFGLARVFGLVFKGTPHEMAQRSPEIHWPMALPMVILAGFVLHCPLVLEATGLLPSWMELNRDVALLLIWSSIFGFSLGAVVYWGQWIAKPVRFPIPALQDLVSYDFYTPKLYRSSIVFGVDVISRFTSWIDQYVVDGIVNLFGLATLFGGQSLKYSNSGQSQFYVFTIVIGITALSLWLGWPMLSHLAVTLSANVVNANPIG